MTWTLSITGPAQKEFSKLPRKDQERVKAALISTQIDPFDGDLKRLKGQPTAWRHRVGNYRIIYDLFQSERLIVVSGILRRTSTTYD
jgi:mRNA interferase RelE/StbE